MKINLKPIAVQTVVVFGASSGIGRLTALEMAGRGARVCAAARSVEGLKSLVEEIEAGGGEAFYVEADAADFSAVKAVADRCVERYGRIDTWVHAAGAFLFATVERTEPEEYKRMIEVNLLGQIYGAKAALPYMKTHGGALIHVTSVEAWRTAPYQSAYGASKHGVQGFLQVLRVELAHENIPVSVTEILPAAINTPIYEKGRNKMPFKMRPVPPIYHPQIVIDAIVYAAENPVRDMVAGAAGLGVVYAERISPRAADFFSETIGFSWQRGGEKDSAEQCDDNLFAPVSGYDTVEGNFSGEQLMSDPYTFIKTSPRAKNSLLAGAIGALFAWMYLKKRTAGRKKREKVLSARLESGLGGDMNGKIEDLIKQAQINEDESSISSAEKTFETKSEAERLFFILKTKLLNIGEWNDHGFISSYELFTEDGRPAGSQTLEVGRFIRIRLKGSGKYDWVRLIDIFDREDEFVLTVKPTFDPTEENPDPSVISHFFTDEAANNFCLSRKDKTVSLYVIGLDEKRNTGEETDGVLETVRNAAVNLGSYLGIQKSEWESFCSGLLECAVDEMRRPLETSNNAA